MKQMTKAMRWCILRFLPLVSLALLLGSCRTTAPLDRAYPVSMAAAMRECDRAFGASPPPEWTDYRILWCSIELSRRKMPEADQRLDPPDLPATPAALAPTADECCRGFAMLLKCMAAPSLSARQKRSLEKLALRHRQEWLLCQLYHAHDEMLHGKTDGGLDGFLVYARLFLQFQRNAPKGMAPSSGEGGLSGWLQEWYSLWEDGGLVPMPRQLPVLWVGSDGVQSQAVRFAALHAERRKGAAMPPSSDSPSSSAGYRISSGIDDLDGQGAIALVFPSMPPDYQITVNSRHVEVPKPGRPFVYRLDDHASFVKIDITARDRQSIGQPRMPICLARCIQGSGQ